MHPHVHVHVHVHVVIMLERVYIMHVYMSFSDVAFWSLCVPHFMQMLSQLSHIHVLGERGQTE